MELSPGGQKGIYGAGSIALYQFLLCRFEKGVVLLETLAGPQLFGSPHCTDVYEEDRCDRCDHHSQQCQAKPPFLTYWRCKLLFLDLRTRATTLPRYLLLNIAS
jgi:hypothetical protein